MKCEVYVRGYRDPGRPQDGILELVDYGNFPPRPWILSRLREIHEKLGDRPGTKPQGVLFLTLEPPAQIADKSPYFAIVHLRPLQADAGARVAYEILALFARRQDFKLDGPEWLKTLAKLWCGIKWDSISRERMPEYDIKDQVAFQENSILGLTYPIGSEDWFVSARLRSKENLILPVADFLLDKELQRRLPADSNIAIGLDQPVHVLPGDNWCWFRLEEALPSNGFTIPNRFAALVQDRSPSDISALQEWIVRAKAAGITEEAIVNTLVGSGWPEPLVTWCADNSTPLAPTSDAGMTAPTGSAPTGSVPAGPTLSPSTNVDSVRDQDSRPWYQTDPGKSWIWMVWDQLGSGLALPLGIVAFAALTLLGLYLSDPGRQRTEKTTDSSVVIGQWESIGGAGTITFRGDGTFTLLSGEDSVNGEWSYNRRLGAFLVDRVEGKTLGEFIRKADESASSKGLVNVNSEIAVLREMKRGLVYSDYIGMKKLSTTDPALPEVVFTR